MAHNLDLINTRGMQQEGALNTDAVRDTTHREAAIDSLPVQTDYNTLKYLQSLAGALDHLQVNTSGITRLQFGRIFAQIVCFYLLNQFQHDMYTPFQSANGQYSICAWTRARTCNSPKEMV